MKTVQILISGLVQGVGFRYFAAQKARVLGIRGYVRNLVAGDVEVLAQADEAMLDVFVRELRVGPRSAQVRELRLMPRDNEEIPNGFEIR